MAHIPARIIVTRAEEIKLSNDQGHKQDSLDIDRTSPGRSSSANNIYNLGMISQCTQVPQTQIPPLRKKGPFKMNVLIIHGQALDFKGG